LKPARNLRLRRALSHLYRSPLAAHLLGPVEARIGTLPRVTQAVRERRALDPPAAGIARFQQVCDTDPGQMPTPMGDGDARPILLLAAGWRSGSTLLQRLVLSSGGVMVWGEPYDRCCLVQRLAGSFRPFGDHWPPASFFLDSHQETTPGALANSWVASLYPDPDSLLSAHRNFLLDLFASPARRLGYERWGLKEVRFGQVELRYLRLLFPDAPIVLLVRDPRACWASNRRFDEVFYASWPSRPTIRPAAFAHLWSRLASDFLDFHHQDHRSLLVRYEDLLAKPSTLDDLERLLGITLDREVLATVQRGGGTARHPASSTELELVRHITSPVARLYGYPQLGPPPTP
jgi:hypothetical protein